MTPPRLPAVLGEPDFRRLFTARVLSAVGDGVALVAVGFAVLDATGSVARLGLVLAARYVPLAAVLLVSGAVADRCRRRRILITSDLVRAASQGCFAILLAVGAASLWSCLVLQAAFGAAEAFFGPALAGLLPRLVRARHLQQANALDEVTFDLSRVLGPGLGGALVIALGSAGAIGADAASFAISAVLLARLRVGNRAAGAGEPAPAGGRRRLTADVLAGWAEVRRRPWILVCVGNFMIFGALGIPAVLVLGPELAWQGLGGTSGWAALTSVFGLGALAGSALMQRLRIVHPGRVLAAMLLLAAARPALFVSGLGLPAIAGCCFLTGAAMSIASVVWALLLQTAVPPDRLSRVGAIDELGTSLLTPVGYTLAGPLATAFGLRATVLALAVVPAVASVATLACPDLRRLGWSAPAVDSDAGAR